MQGGRQPGLAAPADPGEVTAAASDEASDETIDAALAPLDALHAAVLDGRLLPAIPPKPRTPRVHHSPVSGFPGLFALAHKSHLAGEPVLAAEWADIRTGDALVLAYRAYQAATLPPYRISLDRAFNLVSYIDGIWLASAPTLSVLTCPGCGCEFIVAVGTVAHPGAACPFCKLLERFHLDHRIQASYPARPALDMTERQPGMLALFHKLSPEAEGDSPSE